MVGQWSLLCSHPIETGSSKHTGITGVRSKRCTDSLRTKKKRGVLIRSLPGATNTPWISKRLGSARVFRQVLIKNVQKRRRRPACDLFHSHPVPARISGLPPDTKRSATKPISCPVKSIHMHICVCMCVC